MSTCFQNLFHCSQWTDVESTSKERKWTCGGLHLKAWLLINVCSIIFIFQICGNSIAPFKICWGTIGNFEDPVVTEFCFTWKYLIYFIKRFRSSLDWPSKRAATASDSAVTKNKKYIIYNIYIYIYEWYSKARHQVRSTFRSWDYEIARRCGAKHISKSAC